MWRPVAAVGLLPEIQEEYKRMDEDMRITLATVLDSFLVFLDLGPKPATLIDSNIILLEGDDESLTFPRAQIDLETLRLSVIVRIRTKSPERIRQRSPWHIWSDVFTSLVLNLADALRDRYSLEKEEAAIPAVSKIRRKLYDLGRFVIPEIVLDSLSPDAQLIASMGLAAFQDWLLQSEDARPLLNLNLRVWQINPPFEAMFMVLMCEYLETALEELPLNLPRSRPLLANYATPWALHHVGETVNDLNVMWWPEHLDANDKKGLINAMERLHSQASLMTQMLMRS
jgi:hypothetical protein